MANLLQKKALMIAPSYDVNWKLVLPGTVKDIVAMKKVLLNKCGFEEEHITVLQGEEATKDNILKVLKEFTCEDGSVVFVYYSGHGVYLEDSQDEGLLPTIYEWPLKPPQEDACITGNDLFTFFDKLAKKRVRTTVIFDCCYSGQLYRVAEFDQTTGLKARQVILERGDDEPQPKKYRKADRGGWTPDDKDFYFYFAACTPAQVAREEPDKGGWLTMAILNVLNNLKSLENVSYDALFRLTIKEFKEHISPITRKRWYDNQTPQLEAANSNTELFGTSQVIQQEGGIVITEVPDDEEIILGSGVLQSMRPGKYDVFTSMATAESVKEGSSSEHYVASIDVNLIDIAQSVGTVFDNPTGRKITVGCLAYLKTPGSINNNVYVGPVPDYVPQERLKALVKKLIDSLKATNQLNVSKQPSNVKDPDLITISVEKFKGQDCWVARRIGKVLVPPISIDANCESYMANNICRYIRYHLHLKSVKSPIKPEDLLKDVTFKLFKIENVKPYSKYTKKLRIKEGLEGTDISQIIDERPTFKGHEEENGSGDALLFQVLNNKKKTKDTVHICVMSFHQDGEIKALYPKNKKGSTVELRGGDTAEEIFRPFIPKDSLRKMAEPDLNKDEPSYGVDTLVLYASNKPVDYGPLEQSCMQIDQKLTLQRGTKEESFLGSLEGFKNLTNGNTAKDDCEDEFQYYIKKIEVTVTK